MRRVATSPAAGILALVVALVAAGCGSTVASPTLTATPVPTASPAATASPAGSSGTADIAVFAKIESQVQAIRGLTPTATVTPVLLDSKELAAKLAAINSSETDHQALANEGTLLIHMGLLPAGSSLEQMELDLESGQVVGFYDSISKGLYVLSGTGSVGPTEKFVFSHEYTHALQDQTFGLDRLAIDTADQGDRDMARTALVEGDATLLMALWATKGLSPLELLSIAGESMTDQQAAQLAGAPAILRETLTFPYDAGLAFVQSTYDQGGWAAVDRIYSNPPNSTSQILHPELYATGVEPVALEVPVVPASLSGWKLTMQDTMGEFQLGIWLANGKTGLPATEAAAAVSSWGGDRVGSYEGPNGEWAVFLHTTWRTPTGRDSFLEAVRTTLAGLGPEYRVCSSSADVDIVLASSASLLAVFLDCNTMG